MLGAIVEIVPRVWQFANRMIDVDRTCNELRAVLRVLDATVADMDRIASVEEENSRSRKRKRVVHAFFQQVQDYKATAEHTLDEYMAEAQHWMIVFSRIRYVLAIERYLSEGNGYLSKGSDLRRGGLTYDTVIRRGEKLQSTNIVGATAQRHLHEALQALNSGNVYCMGIYGSAGADKTNLMKHLHNLVHDNSEDFEAVFWATAPEEQTDVALQNRLADAMSFNLNDDDVVRRAGQLTRRLDDFGRGRKILFLDNLRKPFSAYEVIAFPSSEHILVFTAPSRDVCNRMHCQSIVKMNLLPREEAEELFLSEAGGPSDCISNQEIQDVAKDVANECARMPLAIILIACSMRGIHDIREWRHRLNELTGRIAAINDDEKMILEQLKFAYTSMNLSETERECFKAATTMFNQDAQLSTQDIIQEWQLRRIIGMDRSPELAYDQGQTILNRLERMCLVEFVDQSNEIVSMNKWIIKMADYMSRMA